MKPTRNRPLWWEDQSMTVLFFLHGLGQTPQSWQEQVTALPEGIRAHAPWLHGLRPDQRSDFDIQAAADEVLSLIPQFTAGPVALCGHSIGATVALAAALSAPDAVSHLVLVSAQVNPPRTVLAAHKMAVRMMPRRRLEASGLDKKSLLKLLDVAGSYDVRNKLGRVTAPTLVVVGERDQLNMPAAEALAVGIPRAVLRIIPTAGHNPNVQSSPALNEALYSFIT